MEINPTPPNGGNPITPPPPDEPEKKDKLKITGIVLAVIAGIILAAAFFCTNGTFPKELLGGPLGVASFFAVGFCVLAAGGSLLLFPWLKRKAEEDAEPLPPPPQ